VFVLGRLFQLILVLVGKPKSLPYSGTPERCFTWVGSGRTRKQNTYYENSSATAVKFFITLAPAVNCLITAGLTKKLNIKYQFDMKYQEPVL
jgi:hypothetical protein